MELLYAPDKMFINEIRKIHKSVIQTKDSRNKVQGGVLKVETKKEKGTVFIITLPRG